MSRIADEPDDWAEFAAWAQRMIQRARRELPGREAHDDERCAQCSFPWHLHPWRYDPGEEAMVRFCSAFPARPVRAVEACIAP